MCNRYTIRQPGRIRISDLTSPFPEDAPNFNVHPQDIVPVIARDDEARLQATRMRWGFIPSYDTSDKPETTPLNARSETVLTSAMFRTAAQTRRCVMPADGFYEWQPVTPKIRIPHFFHFEDDRPFFFASIYTLATEKHPPSCALLTTGPLAAVAPWHHRSPLMLTEAQALAWLEPGEMTASALAALIGATRWGDELCQHRVAPVRGNAPSCVAPYTPEPDLFSL